MFHFLQWRGMFLMCYMFFFPVMMAVRDDGRCLDLESVTNGMAVGFEFVRDRVGCISMILDWWLGLISLAVHLAR